MIDCKSKIDIKGVREAFKEAAIRPLLRCGALVASEAKAGMKKGGRTKGPRGGDRRIPSTPPNPPHAQKGNLRASISFAWDAVKRIVIVGPTSLAKYGKIHEKGGEFGGRNYPARPFMMPGLKRAKEKFAKEFKNARVAMTRMGKALNAKRERL